MYRVKKRNGSIVEFDISKITGAIRKAFDACERNYTDNIIDMIGLKVTSAYEPLIRDNLIEVEDIQDCVERTLSEAGYSDVAKAYILYRKSRENVRNIDVTSLDYKMLVDNYLDAFEWHDKDDSTITYSVGGLILSNSGAITANYWLSEVYDNEIAEAHRSGDIHMHDLSMLTAYCAGWSLIKLIREGLGGVMGKISSSPAKHLSTLCNQMVNFLGIMQNEWAGAQSFSGFDTYLAPFVKEENLSYEEVKQCIQTFIYGVNTPSRWGTQAPFSNISLDWTVPEDLKDVPAVVGGEDMPYTYGDCQKEMDLVNKAFIDIMMEGDAAGNGFQYPIPTYSITRDFKWGDTENNRKLFEMTARYGIPYFANYIHSGNRPDDVRRILREDHLRPEHLYRKAGGYFASGEDTGSIGLITVNLPRTAYLAKDEEDFYKRLDKLMDLSARGLKTKRTVLSKLLDSGLYPFTKRYLGTFEKHFSTIGIMGMNEACLNAKWIGEDLTHEKARRFAEEIIDHACARLLKYQEQYQDPYNLEATSSESTSYRLARDDVEKYPDIITANIHGTPYYTNSTHLPVGFTDDIFSALDLQDDLQIRYTGGTVFHAFIGEKISGWESCALLVRKIAENYKLPYFTISPTYSICPIHKYIIGEVYKCPKCGSETEVYSRIIGYYRPLRKWNAGKKQEFKDRQTYLVEGQVSRSIRDYRNAQIRLKERTDIKNG